MRQSDNYKGREHSGIKHMLLEHYLEMLFMIIGRYENRICYVDCFAGPWKETDENLSSTSISLSLEVMHKCRKSLQALGKDVEFRALYIENDKKAYNKLNSFLQKNKKTGIESVSKKGKFHELIDEILKWCGSNDFVFFFIDPTGWKNIIEISTLTPLLKRPRSEYLINFMYDFLLRTHTQDNFREDMQAIFGVVPDTSGLTPKERETMLISTYREALKNVQADIPDKLRTAYVSILDPVKNRTKYHLVYLTRHPLGIVKFMSTSEKLDIVQQKVRAKTKQERRAEISGMNDLFEGNFDIENNAEVVDIDTVKNYWLKKLTYSPTRFGIDELANMLEETSWFEKDFQNTFKELLNEGKVQNLNAHKARPKKPVHFDKSENLRRID